MDGYLKKAQFIDIPSTAEPYGSGYFMNGKTVVSMKQLSNSGYRAVASCLDDGVWTYYELPYNTVVNVSGHQYIFLSSYASGIQVQITQG